MSTIFNTEDRCPGCDYFQNFRGENAERHHVVSGICLVRTVEHLEPTTRQCPSRLRSVQHHRVTGNTWCPGFSLKEKDI